MTTKASAPQWEQEEKDIKADLTSTVNEINGNESEMSTLPYPGDKIKPRCGTNPESDPKNEMIESDAEADKASIKSDIMSRKERMSRTESEGEYVYGNKKVNGDVRMKADQPQKEPHLEIEVEELNRMPENAVGVFNSNAGVQRSVSMPNPPRCNSACWEEKNPLFGHEGMFTNGYDYGYSTHEKFSCCNCAGTTRDVLKISVSLCMSAILFPILVWGGYTFLPFDAPPLDSAPLRLVYTLRCSVFAIIPVVLGFLVLGVSRARYCSLQLHPDKEIQEVNIHRRYVEDSISLFLLYFLQLSILAAYLSQNYLKLVPLLTIIFALGRLVYWIAAAWGSSLRGFGFGLSFLPMLTMLVANLYFIFLTDSAGSIFAQDEQDSPSTNQQYKPRFWG